MDKVKLALKFLKKQHFWFLLGLVVLVCSYSWYSACGALSTAFTKFKSDIEDRKGKAQRVSVIADHPNNEHHTKEDELIAARTKDVAKAWRINYKKQGDDILTWPAELQKDFIDTVKDMRPIETKARDLEPKFLELYRDYIQSELPKLAEIVGAAWQPKQGAGAPGGLGNEGGRPGLAGPPGSDPAAKNSKPYLMVWSSTDEEDWLAKHFDWSKKPNQLPNTREVLYAQEDLWVLKALLTIIKKVNGNIDQPHLATIKTIEFIHIGRDAITTEGVVQRAKGGGVAVAGEGLGGPGGPNPAIPGGKPPAGPGAPGAAVPPAGPGMREGPPGMGGPGMPAVGGEELADNRYVDDKYKPLSAARLKAIGQTNDEADAHLAVAKRMPIRMRVEMDTRRVHDLLTECANSPLTVEVRQLRVNPERASKGGGNAGGVRGGGVGGEAGAPAPVGGRGGPGAAAGGAYDGIVEVYGIIYIYNPVPAVLEESLAAALAAVGDTKPAPAADAKTGAAGKPADAAASTAPPKVAPEAGKAAAASDASAKPPAADTKAATPAAENKAPEKPAADVKADDLKLPASGNEKTAAPAAGPAAAGAKGNN